MNQAWLEASDGNKICVQPQPRGAICGPWLSHAGNQPDPQIWKSVLNAWAPLSSADSVHTSAVIR